ncbi:uncharacterized protein B0I36DRAFT_128942 [Microdochium trichocladiopsis]|uniref:RRM domain-containing protein n=1 Tax=Microdochium trichocladiopsis TaxID=1682393 RepID=A0A9P8Y402_9PEZI|nr:uncharacterized protein B0I36DRAFT_128942 [Microdochium trichocladiopsis]KAH7029162.1 hypothetical protein B0I36DRAFT_128942 [Microdochium trichocladiopsis]
MTDKTPPLLATADLSPVSPSPLHPSSPVVVPALQEQVDHFDAMTALQTSEAASLPIQNHEQGAANGIEASTVAPSNAVVENNPAQEANESDTTQALQQEDGGASEGGPTPDDADQVPEQRNGEESAADSPERPESLGEETSAGRSPITVVVHGAIQSDGDPEASPHTSDKPSDVDNALSARDDGSVLSLDAKLSVPTGGATEERHQKSVEKGSLTVPSDDNASSTDVTDHEKARTGSSATQPVVAPVPGLQGAQQSGAGISAASKPSTLPPRPPMPVDALPQVPQSLLAGSSASRGSGSDPGISSHQHGQGLQNWDTFQQEERKYVADAKWDRFPDGSRLFIGNLSSERVSKREVFDIFSPFGRLAQISLKQAFGFVQYHTQQEGQAAMNNLQGREIKGRKINLEFSRTQKRNEDGDRRGSRGKSDRRESAETAKPKRDDYRPGRDSPPHGRGGQRQQGSYGEPSRFDGGRYGSRGRSRSPGYGNQNYEAYRRRSPSPRRRQDSESSLDIPRRYGSEVPDVQFLLLQEVERDFVGWVQRAFSDVGLRVDVMFLNPRFPRDAVIQRQIIEGVHAVTELDFRAQQYGRIPLQVFDRSAGRDKVRFDQYQDLEPHIAAQLVARTRAQTAQYAAAPYGASPYPPAPQYPPAGPPVQPAQAYGHPQYPYPAPATQPYGGGAPQQPGSLDNATLHQILGTIQNQQGGAGQPLVGANGSQVDVNAVLAALGNNVPVPQGHLHPQHHPHQYGHPPAPGAHGPPAQGGDSAQHVQNIMSQLARYRQ